MNWRRVLSMKKKYVKRNRSHFWKKRTNSRLNGQRNPTHRSYWIGTVNADWQIAAKVKSASRLVCVCEWKAREIVWMKGQSCVKSFHIFILLPRKGKIKTSFTCYFGDKRQWANHFTNFYRDNDATGGPIRYFSVSGFIGRTTKLSHALSITLLPNSAQGIRFLNCGVAQLTSKKLRKTSIPSVVVNQPWGLLRFSSSDPFYFAEIVSIGCESTKEYPEFLSLLSSSSFFLFLCLLFFFNNFLPFPVYLFHYASNNTQKKENFLQCSLHC